MRSGKSVVVRVVGIKALKNAGSREDRLKQPPGGDPSHETGGTALDKGVP
jgi:hypothetical protein